MSNEYITKKELGDALDKIFYGVTFGFLMFYSLTHKDILLSSISGILIFCLVICLLVGIPYLILTVLAWLSDNYPKISNIVVYITIFFVLFYLAELFVFLGF